MDGHLEIRTFGGLRILKAGETIAGISSRKVEALFIYLALAERPQPREVLADLLWDDRSQRQAMANLRRVRTNVSPGKSQNGVGGWPVDLASYLGNSLVESSLVEDDGWRQGTAEVPASKLLY